MLDESLLARREYHAAPVPMVVAGEGQDKPENIRRVRHAGVGVGLAAARPSAADLRLAIDDVLAEDDNGVNGYRRCVAGLRREMLELDC